ncbi:MAG: GYF domain-containing protein [Luteolibacter sp.]
MNEMTQDAWFYSREGERIGPVTFSDLKIKALEAGLNPRLDMVWTHGMPEWKPAGEIDGLFERRAAPEAVERESSADPYRPPERETPEEISSEEGQWPGARRRSFLFATIGLPFLFALGLGLIVPLLQQSLGQETGAMVVMGLMVLLILVLIYISLQRLVNLGMSRWWYLANLVPFLNLWVGYRTFACPAGYAHHKKLDGAGIFLAIVYWGLLVLSLLVMAAAVALMAGAIGSPELQKQVQEILQKAAESQK